MICCYYCEEGSVARWQYGWFDMKVRFQYMVFDSILVGKCVLVDTISRRKLGVLIVVVEGREN